MDPRSRLLSPSTFPSGGVRQQPQAANYRGTDYDFSDTSLMRGAWMILLINSAKADDSEGYGEKMIFCGQLRRLADLFPCEDCKVHFMQYLEEDRPESVVHMKDGLFGWVVRCMNSVAVRKGKKERDYFILYPMFHGKGMVPCKQQKCAAPTTGGEGGTFTFRR